MELPTELPRLGENTVTVVSYHYDVLMRLRRVRIKDGENVLSIVPVEKDGQLLLEVQS